MTEHEQMLMSILDCRRVDLYIDAPVLTPAQQKILESMHARRAQGEPLQYILGTADFMGLTLKVNRRVLIPRPETEILVEQVLMRALSDSLDGRLHILDLGTGSGCIAIALAKHLPSAAIVAVDVSQDAIDLAQENARAHGVESQIKFVHTPMQEYLNRSFPEQGLFDMIVSNPPYLATSCRCALPQDVQQEPWMALDGGERGLDYYQILVEKSQQALKNSGWLVLEIGDGQQPALTNFFKEHRYLSMEFVNDHVGTPRVVLAQK